MLDFVIFRNARGLANEKRKSQVRFVRTFLGLLFSILSLPLLAVETNDPIISELIFSPKLVDVSSGSKTITARIKVEDESEISPPWNNPFFQSCERSARRGASLQR